METVRHLLPPVPQYFKACLHTHSTLSDGRLTPLELKEQYRAQGYSILCLTDHRLIVDHSQLNEPDFLMLTGVEMNTDQTSMHRNKKTYHLNLIAKRPDLLWQPYPRDDDKPGVGDRFPGIRYGELSNAATPQAVNAMIAAANAEGFLVTYNHPEWSLQDYTDYIDLKGLWAMELCNTASSVMGYNDRDNAKVYRDLCNRGNRIIPIGADDTHRPQDLFGAWAMIGARSLEYGEVIRAMEAGDVYASTGPQIHSLTLQGTTLKITCSDAVNVTLESSSRFAQAAAPFYSRDLLREATFDLAPWMNADWQTPGDWLRLVVHGPNGDYASTRAFFRPELG